MVISSNPKTVTLNLNYLEESQIQAFVNLLDSPEKFKTFMASIRSVRGGLHDVIDRNNQFDNTKAMAMFRALNNMYGVLLFEDDSKNTHVYEPVNFETPSDFTYVDALTLTQ